MHAAWHLLLAVDVATAGALVADREKRGLGSSVRVMVRVGRSLVMRC